MRPLRHRPSASYSSVHHQPGQQRVENGITGTIIDTSRNEDEQRVTIKTSESQTRETDIDTGQFNDLSLAYAVHAHKSQGMTTEQARS